MREFDGLNTDEVLMNPNLADELREKELISSEMLIPVLNTGDEEYILPQPTSVAAYMPHMAEAFRETEDSQDSDDLFEYSMIGNALMETARQTGGEVHVDLEREPGPALTAFINDDDTRFMEFREFDAITYATMHEDGTISVPEDRIYAKDELREEAAAMVDADVSEVGDEIRGATGRVNWEDWDTRTEAIDKEDYSSRAYFAGWQTSNIGDNQNLAMAAIVGGEDGDLLVGVPSEPEASKESYERFLEDASEGVENLLEFVNAHSDTALEMIREEGERTEKPGTVHDIPYEAAKAAGMWPEVIIDVDETPARMYLELGTDYDPVTVSKETGLQVASKNDSALLKVDEGKFMYRGEDRDQPYGMF